MSAANLKKRVDALETYRSHGSRRLFNVFGAMTDEDIQEATGYTPGDGDIVLLHVELGDEQERSLRDRCTSQAV